jgi:hypothetical protein
MLGIGLGAHSNRLIGAGATIDAARTRTSPKGYPAALAGRELQFNVKYLRRLPDARHRQSPFATAPEIPGGEEGPARRSRAIRVPPTGTECAKKIRPDGTGRPHRVSLGNASTLTRIASEGRIRHSVASNSG